MKVETIFTFRDYEFMYEFGVDGEELQKFKTTAGIKKAFPAITNDDDHFLHMLSAGQSIPIVNPDYDAEVAKAQREQTKEGHELLDAEEPYLFVSVLTKEIDVEGQEEKQKVDYVITKTVDYTKHKPLVHTNDQEVQSASQAYTFMHKTAREYTKHRTTNIKVKTLGNPFIKKAMELNIKEDELLKMQNDGTRMSSVLMKIQFNYHYK